MYMMLKTSATTRLYQNTSQEHMQTAATQAAQDVVTILLPKEQWFRSILLNLYVNTGYRLTNILVRVLGNVVG